MKRAAVSSACATVLAVAVAWPAAAQTPEVEPGPLLMHEPRAMHTLTLLPDGSALVVGGSGDDGSLASAEVFDQQSRRFRAVGSLDEARAGHTATALPDGRVLVVGGTPRPRATVEAYDPANESFSPLADLAVPRTGHAATLLGDGTVLITGGQGQGKRRQAIASAEVLDPATGVSRLVGDMRKPRVGHSATLMEDGRVVLVGGIDDRGKPRRAIEIYDPATEGFTAEARLLSPADRHSTTRLDDGRLLVVDPRASMLVATDASSSKLASDVLLPPFAATALLLDGRLVAIGDEGSGPAAVYLYDPEIADFAPADPMTLTRSAPQAVRLADGTVLVVGGWGCDEPLDSAEIWDPEQLRVVATGSTDDCGPPPFGQAVASGHIVLPASAIAIDFPSDWEVRVADPDTDVFSAEPGTAWEALQATAPERAMACSVVVGVAAVPAGTPLAMEQGGVEVPRWHRRQPHKLLVPEPTIPRVTSSHQTSWGRTQSAEGSVGHPIEISLLCMARDRYVDEGSDRFVEIMDSFELLPPA